MAKKTIIMRVAKSEDSRVMEILYFQMEFHSTEEKH